MSGNMFSQMKDLYKLQREAKDMQKKLREVRVSGESDDGRLKIYMNGAQEFEDISIDASLLDGGDEAIFKKCFKEAFKDYQKKLQKQVANTVDVSQFLSR